MITVEMWKARQRIEQDTSRLAELKEKYNKEVEHVEFVKKELVRICTHPELIPHASNYRDEYGSPWYTDYWAICSFCGSKVGETTTRYANGR